MENDLEIKSQDNFDENLKTESFFKIIWWKSYLTSKNTIFKL